MSVDEYCPHCGADLPPNARFCRECGADENVGWGGEVEGLDDDFDYDEFVQREFPDQAEGGGGKPLWIVILIVALCGTFLLTLVQF